MCVGVAAVLVTCGMVSLLQPLIAPTSEVISSSLWSAALLIPQPTIEDLQSRIKVSPRLQQVFLNLIRLTLKC